MKDPFEREVAVFGTARRLPEADRAAYLDEACAGDAALRQRVEELLQAGEQAEGFLQEPAPGAQRPEGVSAVPALVLDIAARGERTGDRIGRYKLLQQIGEGGCGAVYMAQQEEPVRRRVALKVIKLGMDTKQVIARFEAERQALAMMDHPNIAKVHDAGTTETGRPYFVMELVRGIKITQYCDEQDLSTNERLKLFMQVCHAVQHAHQKGIIHRDLKPSNILVASDDGVPVPKVIDFGIAKATQGRLTDQTLFTAFEQFIGTPAYMSPEQAELTMRDADTRTDIYSLGVLLYELLTGETPFDAQQLLASGLDVLRRTIREKEPERPSTRLSTMLANELTATARHRHTEAGKLIHSLRGDLDWIVMKCLEKERSRRYETANGLAMDIQRHLNCEPVVARPPSGLYRLEKAIRRNQTAFFCGLAIAVALLVGSVVSTWQAVRATRAEREQKRLRLEAEAGRAAEAGARQMAEAREQFVKAKIAFDLGNLDQAETSLAEIPPSAIRPDLEHAGLRRLLGTVRAIRGQWKEAAADFSILRRVNTSDARNRDLDLLRFGPVLIELGDTNEYRRFVQETIREWKGASDVWTCERICKACLAVPADEATLKGLAPFYDVAARGVENLGDSGIQRWACTSLALFEYRRGNYAKAIAWSTVTVDGYPEGDPPFLAMGRLLRAMAALPLNLASDGRADLTLAGEAISEGIKRLSGTTDDNIGSFDWLFARVLLHEAEAAYRNSSGRPSTTIAASPATPPPHGAIGVGSWNTAVQFTNIVVTSNGATLYQSDFVNSGTNDWRVYRGDWTINAGLYQQSSASTIECQSTTGNTNWANYTLALRAREIRGSEGFLILFNWLDDDNWTLWDVGGWGNKLDGIIQLVNGTKTTLAQVSQSPIRAGVWYDIAIVLSGQRMQCYLNGSLVQDVSYPPTSWSSFQASSNHAKESSPSDSVLVLTPAAFRDFLVAEGKPDQASEFWRKMREILPNLARSEQARLTAWVGGLAESLRLQGQTRDAEIFFDEAIALVRKYRGETHPLLGALLYRYGEFLNYPGSVDRAAAQFRLALPIRRQAQDDDLVFTLRDLGCVLFSAGKSQSAEPYLREALTLYRKLHQQEDVWATASTARILGQALESQERWPEAEKSYRDSLAAFTKSRIWNSEQYCGAFKSLVLLLANQNESSMIAPLYREQLPAVRGRMAADEPALADLLADFTSRLLADKTYDEAEPAIRECLGIREKKIPDSWATFSARSMLGAALLGQRKYAEAETWLRSGYEGLQLRHNTIPPDDLALKQAVQRLVQYYEATGPPDQAAEWKRKLGESDQAPR